MRPAPRWFRGEELDLVDAGERRAVYRRTLHALEGSRWWMGYLPYLACLVGVVPELPIAPHLQWLVLSSAATLGWVLPHRWIVRRLGRRWLRESADWPLRVAASPAPTRR